jgi:hypothetical protein
MVSRNRDMIKLPHVCLATLAVLSLSPAGLRAANPSNNGIFLAQAAGAGGGGGVGVGAGGPAGGAAPGGTGPSGGAAGAQNPGGTTNTPSTNGVNPGNQPGINPAPPVPEATPGTSPAANSGESPAPGVSPGASPGTSPPAIIWNVAAINRVGRESWRVMGGCDAVRGTGAAG